MTVEGSAAGRVQSLLERAVERIRHDHAYPMEFGPHHCPGCDIETDILAALGRQPFCRSPFCSVSPDLHDRQPGCPTPKEEL